MSMTHNTHKNLDWNKLLSPMRRRDLAEGGSLGMGTAGGRLEIERDYDRILFSAPTRRLGDKTQVFPLEPNDSVRTRLTHSHEVSNLCRSIGLHLAFNKTEIFCSGDDEDEIKRTIPSVLAAIGLAHDLGNPPFGHQGESAMQEWFSENLKECHSDFKYFNGNAQTLRVLSRLQILDDDYGLNLTCATLTALMKYPCFSTSRNSPWNKKFCVFESDREIAETIWKITGLRELVRHPLTYVMEACDDIAYSVIDAEDTVKKGYASFYDLLDYLEVECDDDLTKRVIKKAKEKNDEYRELKLSSNELNDISMQMFRVKAIYEMVNETIIAFEENLQTIMSGEVCDIELMEASEASSLCKALKRFDLRHGFKHREVLRLELQGDLMIKSIMALLWDAIKNCSDGKDSNSMNRYTYSLISENYRRIFNRNNEPDDYCRAQLLADFISGMTDGFLVKTYSELVGFQNGGNIIPSS